MGRAPIRGAVDLHRIVIAVVMLGVLVATLSWLQSRFDSSDHDKATNMVRAYKPEGGALDITQAILARHPTREKHDISWRSEIRSSCLGHVRVSALLPEERGDPEITYAFDVDLTAPSIHPTDPKTIEIFRALEASTSSVTEP
jgi:hypothetical protein